MTFSERVKEHAERRGEAKAIVHKGGELTYRQLNTKVNKLGNALIKAGVQYGDRVAIQLLNVPEFIISYLAIQRIGAIVVPINPLYKERELENLLVDSGAEIIITAPIFTAAINLSTNLAQLKKVILTGNEAVVNCVSFEEFIQGENESNIDIPLKTEEVAEIIYTSGTTGIPKGAMLTHGNLYSNASVLKEYFGITENEHTLCLAPLFHIAAQTVCMTSTIVAGGINYLLPRWVSAEETLEAMENWQISLFFGPPTMYTFMTNCPTVQNYNLSSLTKAVAGAASLPVEVFNKFKELTGIEILEGYGLSETSPVSCMNPPNGQKKSGSIGIAFPGVQVKIFNENNEELPNYEIGEIVIKGPNVMKGYYQKPDETIEAMRSGWFHTGDMAYRDEEGYFFIVDRKKDMVNRGGLKIYPREVEEIIYKHPSVLEVAVVGIPDRVMGEEIKAYITLKENKQLDMEELKQMCKEELAHFKVPKYFQVVQELPKTPTGKILKNELRKFDAS